MSRRNILVKDWEMIMLKGKIAEHNTTNKEMITQISDYRQELINRFVMKKIHFVDW